MDFMNSWSFRKKLLVGCYGLLGMAEILQLIKTFILGHTFLEWVIQLILTLGIAFPLIRMIESKLTETVEHMTRVAMNVAKGDFSQKVRIESNDAFGDLGNALNQMIDKLRGILKDTTSIARQVSDTTINIRNKSQEFRDVLGQVAISTNELAVGASSISEDVSDMTGSVRDIEGKVENFANSAKSMNDQSGLMIALVEKGRNAVEGQGMGMKSNIAATLAVAATIKELAQQAEGITKITRTIKDIAEQTNLLSLNASIEAARAGEHGRGFAVVAQQVRNLAEESTQATKEVFNLVNRIQNGVKEASENIKANEEIVNMQSGMIEETAQVFNEIVQGIQYITEQIHNFNKESEVMLDGARKISSAIENISAITQESAAGTEEVSASMNEQIASIQEMTDQADRMSQVSGQMLRTIQIFRLD
ncbi:methyl-accepting chemotaxis protein [Paenibacillus sp. YN15]|uniref:methyl-accepting chemotaxis protein n=1 Tax=Paenibacillus sp. YN15 TaxID=1742774 RepID=UPI0015EC710D|nr:HAMP domain-containing methyl-accepting chemotaxis protein [Paenibacillus sp. YN15]